MNYRPWTREKQKLRKESNLRVWIDDFHPALLVARGLAGEFGGGVALGLVPRRGQGGRLRVDRGQRCDDEPREDAGAVDGGQRRGERDPRFGVR